MQVGELVLVYSKNLTKYENIPCR